MVNKVLIIFQIVNKTLIDFYASEAYNYLLSFYVKKVS